MKKLLFAAILLVSTQSFAQTEKGKFMVGAGVASATGSFQATNHTYSISINPQAGLFVADRWVVGTTLLLGYAHGPSLTQIGYGLSPFSRYYFSAKKTTLFVDGSVGFTRYNILKGEGTGPRNITFFSMNAGPGVAYFIVPNVSMEGTLKVARLSSDRGTATVQPFLTVGFQVYLSRKPKVEVKDDTRVED